ncbi:MAG: hypothetical protein KatS3mg103_1222 [Phycisphaerales bacterium]|nr:MAG: hypothetical protein KatS3mg103_1222 [Phycisphaerales bacterium]
MPSPMPPAGGIPTRKARRKSSSSVRKVASSSPAPASCWRNLASCTCGSFSSVYAGPISMPAMNRSQRSASSGRSSSGRVSGLTALG